MNLPTQRRGIEPPNFRSHEFRDAALALVQITGCTLALCRQELFSAEGDMDHAYAALLERKAGAVTPQVLH